MLQVVFGDSEKATLALAMETEKESLIGSAVFCCGSSDDIPQEEKQKLIQHIEQQHKKELERAIPLAGTKEDCMGIFPMLDYGNIQESLTSLSRKEELVSVFTANPWNENFNWEESALEYWNACCNDLASVTKRAAKGEPVRIWFSDAPYSQCGFYALVHFLQKYHCPISFVKLPPFASQDTSPQNLVSWAEVPPGDWASFLPYETSLPHPQQEQIAAKWEDLQKQNSPLRAVINGQLLSVGIDFYDPFILQECSPKETTVGQVIGSALGKNSLAISDWLLAERIRALLKTGVLTLVKEDPRFYASFIAKTE